MTDKLVVKKKNHAFLTIKADPAIEVELSDFFTFYVPGYKFMPAYKNKVWDGKIKLFNRMTGELSAGLYVYLIKFAAERSYLLDTEESDYGLPIPDPQAAQSVPHLLADEALPFQPRDYQLCDNHSPDKNSSNSFVSYWIR